MMMRHARAPLAALLILLAAPVARAATRPPVPALPHCVVLPDRPLRPVPTRPSSGQPVDNQNLTVTVPRLRCKPAIVPSHAGWGGSSLDGGGGGSSSDGSGGGGSHLPFTGLDLQQLLVEGAALVAAGSVALRALGRRRARP